MRTLWNIISFLAVVHLLALVMFIAWLWQSQRLTSARVQEVRHIFATTVPEAQATAAKAAADMQRQQEAQTEAERQANPPLDSASQVQYISLIKQEEDQARRRLEDEKKALLEQLALATDAVSQKQVELDRQRTAWENATKDDQQRKTDEQFLQAVRQYEQLTPKQGKKMLVELINQKQMEQAVAYLNAMNVRAASKILKEFRTDAEIALATELLERLRTYGQEPHQAKDAATASGLAAGASAAQELGNANGSASAAR